MKSFPNEKISPEKEKTDKPQKKGDLRTLFFTTLYISAFTFGGGFVIVTFMRRKFVEELGWIDEKEMLDLPPWRNPARGLWPSIRRFWWDGRSAGPPIDIRIVLGTILPPMVIISVISLFYAAFAENIWVAAALRGMQSGVAAVILDVACDLGSGVLKEKSILSAIVLAAAFFCSFFLDVSVVWIILAAAAAGIVNLIILRRRSRHNRGKEERL